MKRGDELRQASIESTSQKAKVLNDLLVTVQEHREAYDLVEFERAITKV